VEATKSWVEAFRSFEYVSRPKMQKVSVTLVSCSISATHRDRFLPKVIAIHLELFVLLQRSVEEDNDIHLGGLKGAREELNELKTAIELAATSPICWQSIMTIIINVVVVAS
jgi:hypothetical protein